MDKLLTWLGSVGLAALCFIFKAVPHRAGALLRKSIITGIGSNGRTDTCLCPLTEASSFDQNHNLIRDPEFLIHTDGGHWTPVSLRRGDHVMEAVDLDEQDRIIQVDSVKVGEIEKELEMFVGRLREEGWLERARVVIAVPRISSTMIMN